MRSQFANKATMQPLAAVVMMFTKMSVIAYAPPLYVKLTPEIGDYTIISSANM